jgi:mannitol-1-phosphate/altronate dehydrogenase
MHFAVKTAHTPGAKLNDPLSDDILSKAKMSLQPNEIVLNLLSIQKIFGTDLTMHEGFVAELQSAFADLARNPAVATATQIAL